MDKPKIKWSFTIVVDVLLVNLAFLFAYLTSRQFGFDFLEQPAPLFAILQNADLSPLQPQHVIGLGTVAGVTIVRIGFLLAFNLYKPRRMGDRCGSVRAGLVEESPSTNGQGRLLTAGRGDPTESATERIPLSMWASSPVSSRVRANGCGKSAPRRR